MYTKRVEFISVHFNAFLSLCTRHASSSNVCLFQILIGNAQYNCSCVRHAKAEGAKNLGLTVGLSVGCGVLLLVIIIAIIVAVARCRRRSYGPTDDAANAFYNDGAASTNSDYPPSDQQHSENMAAAAAQNAANPPPYKNIDDVPTKSVDDLPYDLPAEKQ